MATYFSFIALFLVWFIVCPFAYGLYARAVTGCICGHVREITLVLFYGIYRDYPSFMKSKHGDFSDFRQQYFSVGVS